MVELVDTLDSKPSLRVRVRVPLWLQNIPVVEWYTRLVQNQVPQGDVGSTPTSPTKVLRQTEEATLIVASSYNAVVKWSLMNSLYFYLRISYKSNYTCLPSRRFRGSTGIPLYIENQLVMP